MTPCEEALLKAVEKQDGAATGIKNLADASFVSYSHARRCINGNCLKEILIKTLRPGHAARIIIKQRKDKRDGHDTQHESETEVLAGIESGNEVQGEAGADG
jgi:hypothetical protein